MVFGMLRRSVYVACGLCLATAVQAQDFALKTNALYWAAATPNLSFELKMAPKATLDLAAAYNPWTFQHDKKMRFWLAQPEFRYWFCETFEGHFIGFHLHGAQYYGGFNDKIYDGYLAGAGFSYGYDWIVAPHWNIEATLGVGYARLWYKEMPNVPCLKCYQNKALNYIGVTRVGLSVSYMF